MPCFKISGVSAETFRPMFSSSDGALGAAGMTRCIADAKPGYPCRVSMVDAEIGETLILGTFEHHAVNGPFRASGPIFVREAAASPYASVDEVPERRLEIVDGEAALGDGVGSFHDSSLSM